MIASHRHAFVFVKTKKTAGTSTEVHLSRYAGELDVISPIRLYDERARRELGFTGPQNFGISTLELAPGDIEDAARYRSLREGPGVRFERLFYPHMPAWEIRERLGAALWEKYFTFAFERNPWDKTVSAFHFEKNRRGLDITFEEFMHRTEWLPVNYKLYTHPDDAAQILVDRVYKYEDLSGALQDLAGRFGWPAGTGLPVHAKSEFRPPESDYRSLYSAQTRAHVAEIFRAEIELFGYEF